MNTMLKKLTLLFAAFILVALFTQSVSASSYAYPQGNYGGYEYPIYSTGYYSNTWSYGWSGWGYNRINYNYHYPYSNYNYYNYPSYGYGGYGGNYNGYWNRHYMYQVYPVAVAYPFPGYYW